MKQLAGFKKIFDPVLKVYLTGKEKELAKISPQIKPVFSQIKKLASGGKRLRPFFAYLGYFGFGGKNKEKILPAGLSIELYHLFCLIHDDIIDKADTRRGVETINAMFGNDAAILAGDLVFSLSEEIVQDMPNYWQELKQEVIIGQYLEIFQPKAGLDPRPMGRGPRPMAEKIMELKTARYTVLRPLQIGAALAGAPKKEIEKLKNYAIPAGIAFQIRDDLLDREKTTSQKLANKLIIKAKKGLENVRIRKEEKKILASLAKFMVERKQ